ncbi:MAG: DUF6491 family protein [Woeseiaceae bacterium]
MDSSTCKTVVQLTAGMAAAVIVLTLTACAAQPDPDDLNDKNAIDDFIVVTELEALDSVRFRRQFNYKPLNEEYVILTSHHDYYLVEFRRRCRELDQKEVTPDFRFDRNVLRAGIDTIRGCPIGRMFAIDSGQAEELEHIGIEP